MYPVGGKGKKSNPTNVNPRGGRLGNQQKKKKKGRGQASIGEPRKRKKERKVNTIRYRRGKRSFEKKKVLGGQERGKLTRENTERFVGDDQRTTKDCEPE